MGILDSVFNKATDVPGLPSSASILPSKAIKLIKQGILPSIHTNSVLLLENEECCYVDKSYMVFVKTMQRRRGKRSGVSIRVVKGITYHTGGFESTPTDEKQVSYIPGYFFVTNKRIVFVSKEMGFEEKIRRVTAIIPYSNGVGVQVKNKTVQFVLPTADLEVKVIQIIRKQ